MFVVMYVAGNDKQGQPLAPALWEKGVEDTVAFFTALFGGTFLVNGRGAWENPDTHKIMYEPCVRVESATDKQPSVELLAELSEFAMQLGAQADQHTVMFTVAGTPVFVTIPYTDDNQITP